MTKKDRGEFIMPWRLASDPEPDMLRVYRVRPDHFAIEVGNGQSFMLSEYNAARVCATLAFMLKLRLHPSDGEKLALMLGPKEPARKAARRKGASKKKGSKAR